MKSAARISSGSHARCFTARTDATPEPLGGRGQRTATATNGRPKTTGQLRTIFAVGKERGLDHDSLREMAGGSLRELSYSEAEKLIQRLKGQSFVPLRTLQHRRAKAGVKVMVQQTQLDLIAQLAAQRQWTNYTLTAFCLKVCKRGRPATTNEANKIIEALKAMNRRDDLWAA